VLQHFFFLEKKKTCAKRKTNRNFLVEVFTKGKKFLRSNFLCERKFDGKAFFSKKGLFWILIFCHSNLFEIWYL